MVCIVCIVCIVWYSVYGGESVYSVYSVYVCIVCILCIVCNLRIRNAGSTLTERDRKANWVNPLHRWSTAASPILFG